MMTQNQIYERFKIAPSDTDYPLDTDEDLICFIGACIETKELLHNLQLHKTLGKIKDEITEERKGYPPSADYYKAINKVLDIINKHLEEN